MFLIGSDLLGVMMERGLVFTDERRTQDARGRRSLERRSDLGKVQKVEARSDVPPTPNHSGLCQFAGSDIIAKNLVRPPLARGRSLT
ncbi:hypothetical protein D4764_18G0013130 [Takifugu flavidus]|uniref:Uncharacterized protein n=1 Tax=Takifugu flavidus TaxID=433684 RepID=A0A5C6NXP9_9TELE|nr:hypothetical protein D4764_18G0013130 [Takifugu flavidus]